MPNDDYLKEERRQYIRLDTVFPVQFRLQSPDGKNFLSEWQQGFTNNVSKGGLCLQVNNLNPDLARQLAAKQAKLSLDIEMPITRQPISAIAVVAWAKSAPQEENKYFFGVRYEKIDGLQNKRIMRYAVGKRLFVPLVLTVILSLSLAFIIASTLNIKLIKGNKALVEQLVKIVQESSVAKQKIKAIAKEKEGLQLELQALELRIKAAEDEQARSAQEQKLEKEKVSASRDELNALVTQLAQDKSALQEQLIKLQHKENAITEDLLRLEKRKVNLEKANLDKMYTWLKVHQHPRTGLVVSFEGDSDLNDWAFTYDQSLVVQLYANFSDFDRARKILDFFDKNAKRIDGRFLNAYYASGGAPAEYVVHTGPNVWLGIAIVHYTKKSGDESFLRLAEEIASATIHLQNQDRDGGIRGGPNVSWYSTEHNLDAYAFFDMLNKLAPDPRYAEARDKILNWLVAHTYDKVETPVRRGKGDSTIATDTYAYSILALGPEKLESLGMSPDRILEFAQDNCAVTVSYKRPDGRRVEIKGFDFAPRRHVARGGVVSSEWSAQMVLAFKAMADFYYKKDMVAKARMYMIKADEYLSELGNMVISSPSPSGQGESCLPYATQDSVDTGHGWMTPKGQSTGSVSGTSYALFAFYNYNPLELKE